MRHLPSKQDVTGSNPVGVAKHLYALRSYKNGVMKLFWPELCTADALHRRNGIHGLLPLVLKSIDGF